MLSIWTKGYAGGKRNARIKEVQSFQYAFDQLKQILEQEYRKKDSVRDYSPGWESKQIAVNEYNAVLDDILKLLTVGK